MIDFAKITVSAGKGGNGAGTFRAISGKTYGKADGGDGGSGGNVYAEASRDINTLEKYRFVKNYEAQNGQMGLSNHRRGATGEDLVLKVPIGTQIKVENAEFEQSYDLTSDSQKVLLARGGIGGRGNSKIRDEFGRRPRAGEKGEEGESLELTLELKLIADIGLIGLPNAGKSTLIATLTAAKPAIAAYPFTTLEPNLGVMVTNTTRLVIADIPGLIEGASEGKGLGDLFLRHVERTKTLLHLIDVTAQNVWENYQTIRNELKVYSEDLAKKKEIVLLTKVDIADEKQINAAQQEFKKHKKKILLVSSETKQGIDELRSELSKIVEASTSPETT